MPPQSFRHALKNRNQARVSMTNEATRDPLSDRPLESGPTGATDQTMTTNEAEFTPDRNAGFILAVVVRRLINGGARCIHRDHCAPVCAAVAPISVANDNGSSRLIRSHWRLLLLGGSHRRLRWPTPGVHHRTDRFAAASHLVVRPSTMDALRFPSGAGRICRAHGFLRPCRS